MFSDHQYKIPSMCACCDMSQLCLFTVSIHLRQEQLSVLRPHATVATVRTVVQQVKVWLLAAGCRRRIISIGASECNKKKSENRAR